LCVCIEFLSNQPKREKPTKIEREKERREEGRGGEETHTHANERALQTIAGRAILTNLKNSTR